MKTSRNYKVPVLMTDRYTNLTMRNLAAMMFEVSYIQATEAEKDLDMENLRWIVYSWDLEIIEPINVDDQLEVSTVAVDMKKFYAYRNYFVKRDGKVIAQAYVVFLLMDIARMRPVKTSNELREAYEPEEALYKPEKLSYAKDFPNKKEIQIRRTDIDTNFHVNNTLYFDYVTDLIGYDSKDIKYFNIVYKHEIRDKEKIIGEYNKNGYEIDFRLRDMDSDTIFTYGKVVVNV